MSPTTTKHHSDGSTDGQIIPLDTADDASQRQQQGQDRHPDDAVGVKRAHIFSTVLSSCLFYMNSLEKRDAFLNFLPSSMNDFILNGGTSLCNWHFFGSVWTKKTKCKKFLHFGESDKYPGIYLGSGISLY